MSEWYALAERLEKTNSRDPQFASMQFKTVHCSKLLAGTQLDFNITREGGGRGEKTGKMGPFQGHSRVHV